MADDRINPYQSPGASQSFSEAEKERDAGKGAWVSGENLKLITPLLNFLAHPGLTSVFYDHKTEAASWIKWSKEKTSHYVKEMVYSDSTHLLNDKIAVPSAANSTYTGELSWEAVNLDAPSLKPKPLSEREATELKSAAKEVAGKLRTFKNLISAYITENKAWPKPRSGYGFLTSFGHLESTYIAFQHMNTSSSRLSAADIFTKQTGQTVDYNFLEHIGDGDKVGETEKFEYHLTRGIFHDENRNDPEIKAIYEARDAYFEAVQRYKPILNRGRHVALYKQAELALSKEIKM
jgi:hypothetical protein